MPVSFPSDAASTLRLDRPSYLIGRDGEGCWVAVDGRGLGGGLFRTQEAATRYVCGELGCRPADVRVSPGTLRLPLS